MENLINNNVHGHLWTYIKHYNEGKLSRREAEKWIGGLFTKRVGE